VDRSELQTRREQLAQGIVGKYGNRASACMAHTNEELGATLRVFEKCVGTMQEQN
jgi:hypothetical protein